MKLKELQSILEAEVLCGEEGLGREIKTACGCDLMSDVLTFAKPGSILLTGLAHTQAVRTAEMADMVAICFVRGKNPSPDILELAARKALPVLRTTLSMYEACGRLFARGLGGYEKPA